MELNSRPKSTYQWTPFLIKKPETLIGKKKDSIFSKWLPVDPYYQSSQNSAPNVSDFNIRPNTMNLIEEEVGNSLELIDTF